jgi:hypothetical protein
MGIIAKAIIAALISLLESILAMLREAARVKGHKTSRLLPGLSIGL